MTNFPTSSISWTFTSDNTNVDLAVDSETKIFSGLKKNTGETHLKRKKPSKNVSNNEKIRNCSPNIYD